MSTHTGPAGDTVSDKNVSDKNVNSKRRRDNLRTAVVLFVVALGFYFGIIFLGPLAR